ncbi:MAG: hypothetical protein EOP23_08800 [Hyphomicrobiales bacterium]|nr:MAG: hypothetical protein EOP23_08800 [Hyphomicrobiales bacterium]
MVRNGMARIGLAAALLVAAAPAAEAAGLFDDLARALFGGGPRLRASPIYEYDDEPRMRAPRVRAPSEVSSKPKPPVVQLDPQADKQWYLKDPTLRRGDIVVTARGVLVYQGRDADAARPADFVALGGNDAKGWKQQLQMAAAGGRARFGDLSAPTKASLTAEAAE